ncbi:MAG: hypothetical protein HN759_12280 [Akkermansiaceae bacterium]|jgi:hypothetical protein|nr:hypothetical protein [Akkermansiaceae bacterium]
MSQSNTSSRNRIMLIAMSVIIVAAAVCWKIYQADENSKAQPAVKTDCYPGLNLKQPQASYQLVRYVFEQGGDELTRKLAINWLDKQSRQGIPLDEQREKWLLDVLTANGHAGWGQEYRFWIFNSAFNVLQMGKEQEKFTRFLQKLALDDSEKTMRLYALQHLELQRSAGNLDGALADEIKKNLQELTSKQGSQTAGTALAMLIKWDGSETPPDPELVSLALGLVKDSERPVDIRVTAIHTVGDEALATARVLAFDTTQPTMVRKAAIACIGRHGSAADMAKLKSLKGASFRITQATRPAIQLIRKRLSNKSGAEPIPF